MIPESVHSSQKKIVGFLQEKPGYFSARRGQMNVNRIRSMLVTILFVCLLGLVAAYQLSNPDLLDNSPPVSAEQARWDAKGAFYSNLMDDHRSMDIHVEQARWDAKGEFFSSLANNVSDSGAVVNQARWDAKGEFFTRLSASGSEIASIAEQARWDAKGLFYGALNSAQLARGNAAAQDRWDAMGFAYGYAGDNGEELLAAD